MVRPKTQAEKNQRTPKGPRPCMQSVPVVRRGPAREVSMTSRVAGRKEVRAEEASCHVPTMTTVLWSWELRCWGPCLHGILRQPMGRADVHRTPRHRHGQCALAVCEGPSDRTRKGTHIETDRGGRDAGPREQQKWCALTPRTLTLHRLPGCGTAHQGRPHMDNQNKTSACGRLRAGPVSESEP